VRFLLLHRRPARQSPRGAAGLKAMDTGRVLGDEWNKLREEEKSPYQELAQKDREIYNEENRQAGDLGRQSTWVGPSCVALGAAVCPLGRRLRPKCLGRFHGKWTAGAAGR